MKDSPNAKKPVPSQVPAKFKHKILVVDDEPEALELLRFNLKQAGFDVLRPEGLVHTIKKFRYMRTIVLQICILL